MKSKPWTKEEVEKLQSLYEENGLGSEEISKILRRTATSIHIKCKRLKFKHNKNQTFELKSRNVTREKNPMFGKEGPNKGKTKENSERIRIAGEKIREGRILGYKNGILKKKFGADNPMFEKDAWNKGKTKENDVRLKHVSLLMSKISKERWEKLSEEEKERRRILWASQAKKKKHLRSSIEIIVENSLKEIGIDFIPSFRMGRFLLDFWIPSKKICIECNGDYWHCNPNKYSTCDKYQKNNTERDSRKKEMLLREGFSLLVLWEEEIRLNKAKEIIERFLDECKK